MRDLARQLEPTIASLLYRTTFLLGEVLLDRESDDARDVAYQRRSEAIHLLDQLEEAIQRA